MNLISKLVLSIFIISNCSFIVKGQNLPYSRYGLGTLFDPEFTNLRGWGGLSAAYHSPFSINFANPASYSDIKLATLDAAFFISGLHLRTPDTSVVFSDGTISNLVLAFPVIKNKAGISFGLSPFSRVGYSITQENDSSDAFGRSFNLFQGQGGLYRFYFGGGYKYKQLAVGVNFSYLFGNINYTDILAFPESLNAFNTRRQETRQLGDFLIDAGVQYRIVLDKSNTYSLDLGASGNLKTDIKANRDLIYDRFTYTDDAGNSTSTINPKDTIYSNMDEAGEVTLPATFAAGAIFSKQSKYSFGINYKYTMWSQYQSFGESDETANTWKLAFGGEFIPDSKSYQQYWKVMAYRLGMSMGRNYVELNDAQLKQLSVTMGVGFPLRRSFSQISLAGEWIGIGSLKENPVAGSVFRLTAGFTFNDKWFQKRRFD
ncbi:MAG: hypothetical protein IPG01_06265 [Chitinophagaceae bacterium]|nr:hypothetical protein [Chitinophagaceae bacterium]